MGRFAPLPGAYKMGICLMSLKVYPSRIKVFTTLSILGIRANRAGERSDPFFTHYKNIM